VRFAKMALCASAAAGVLWFGHVAIVAPSQSGEALSLASAQAPTTATGRLLFTREGGLWSLRLGEGQPPAQLVPRPRVGLILSGRWSPDGSRLAYNQYEVVPERNAPVSSIFIASGDGSDPRPLVVGEEPGTQLQEPTWSNDGRFVYFLHRRSGLTPVQRIERVEVASGQRTPVMELYGQFDVSADGRWLAVAHAPSGRAALTLLDLQNGATRDLIPVGPFELISAPRFDPTSQTLLFSGISWDNLAPSQPQPQGALPGFMGVAPGPSVAQAHGLPQDLYTIPVAGGTPRRLTSLLLDDPVGAWAPDGSHLALLAGEFLAVTPAAEGTPTPLLTPGGYGSVDWLR